jgi:Na+:H+ antiporter, NhaA family
LPAKAFLLALAIVDDLGAVAVIALFYIQDLNVAALVVAMGVWTLALLYGRARASSGMVYAVLGSSSGISCCNRTCMRPSPAS